MVVVTNDNICEYCGKVFTNIKTDQRYCSHSCYSKSISKKIKKTCETCNVLFYSSPSHNRKYCSCKCYNDYKLSLRKVNISNCKYCNKEFVSNTKGSYKLKYCSEECRNSYKSLKNSGKNNILYNSTKKNCLICDKQFSTQNHRKNKVKYCSHECYSKSLVGKSTGIKKRDIKFCKQCDKKFESIPSIKSIFCSHRCYLNSIKSDRHDSKYYGRNKAWILSVKKRDKYTCVECGYYSKKYIHAHHILSWKDYPNSRFDINNGITLCLKCHMKKHPKQSKALFSMYSKKEVI